MTGFTVINPGMLSLIQDSGRYGFLDAGITTGAHLITILLAGPISFAIMRILLPA